MSLNFNSRRCSVPLPYTDQDLMERGTLVFASQVVDLSSITPENVREWIVRWIAWNDRFDCDLPGPDTFKMIERWVGLETNVEDKSRDEWQRRLTIRPIEKGEIAADEYLGVVA